jgi:hypothetical protein
LAAINCPFVSHFMKWKQTSPYRKRHAGCPCRHDLRLSALIDSKYREPRPVSSHGGLRLFRRDTEPLSFTFMGVNERSGSYSGEYETDISVGAKDIKVMGLAAFAALKEVPE